MDEPKPNQQEIELLKKLSQPPIVEIIDPLKPWTPGEVCQTCGGTGKDPQEGVCPECNGFGHDGRYEKFMGQSPIEAARETAKMLKEADQYITTALGVPANIIFGDGSGQTLPPIDEGHSANAGMVGALRDLGQAAKSSAEAMQNYSQAFDHYKGMGKRGRVVGWNHPTQANHAETKKRRQMASRSRKINRRK